MHLNIAIRRPKIGLAALLLTLLASLLIAQPHAMAAGKYDVPFMPQNLSGQSSTYIVKVKPAQQSFTRNVRVKLGPVQRGWMTDTPMITFKARANGPALRVVAGRVGYWKVPDADRDGTATFYYEVYASAKLKVNGTWVPYRVSRKITIRY